MYNDIVYYAIYNYIEMVEKYNKVVSGGTYV